MDTLIRKRSITEKAPMKLLLTADPSEEIIQDYLERGVCYICQIASETVGVFVLLHTRPETVELVNIAVDEKYSGRGIGKRLVLEAINEAKKMKLKRIEVGTGNSSIDQLAFYQKCGFRIIGIDIDFFEKNYKEEIFENGIRCRDMIRMKIDL